MRTFKYRDTITNICDCTHMSAEEIFATIKKIHPDVGRATIYRNIDAMSNEGILRKIPGVN